MRREVEQLQRALDAKERKLQELVSGTGQVPALKQHYDRVLADLQSERDSLISERKALMDVSGPMVLTCFLRSCLMGCWRPWKPKQSTMCLTCKKI